MPLFLKHKKDSSGKAPAKKVATRSCPDQNRFSRNRKPSSSEQFLPTCRAEMQFRHWDELDILLISGDAYADHPAFGIPLLGRLWESLGYRVGIISQPRWQDSEDIVRMGRPKLFCGISAGCLDSMVNHYTAFLKKRHDDAYTPGGKSGARPNRACIVYCNLVKAAFPGLFVVLGGIEASLRGLAHYDYWSDSLRRSILLDSKADLLIYGMAEHSATLLAEKLQQQQSPAGLPGTIRALDDPGDAEQLPSFEAIQADKTLLLTASQRLEQFVHAGGKALAQKHGQRYVLVEAPAPLLSPEQLDRIYALPFTRQAHPSYKEPIPALEMVQWSVTALRGCGGGCSFCSLALHQGRHLVSRSVNSILAEVQNMTTMSGWKGNVSDVGGPSANLWGASCRIQGRGCRRESCLSPQICSHLQMAQKEYLAMLRQVKKLSGVKNVAISSGIRHDLALLEPEFIRGLSAEFVSGQLKLAPEHGVPRVLKLMRKADFSCFERFVSEFEKANQACGKKQYIVPYIISAFPGCSLEDMQKLANWFHQRGWKPQQVQCFMPTPGTVASAMYYAEIDDHGKPIQVAKSEREKRQQHATLFPAASSQQKRFR